MAMDLLAMEVAVGLLKTRGLTQLTRDLASDFQFVASPVSFSAG